MSLSDAGDVPAPSSSTTPTSSTGQKQHCRSKRKKRLGVVIDPKASFKPKYAKHPHHHHHPEAAAAPMIPRPCTECGKRFWSWKALFGHMRCHPERQWRGINPPPNLQRQPPPPPPPPGDQTPAELLMTAEDHEIAAGLLLLANSEGPAASAGGGGPSSSTRFECSSCKKVFSSRQALGGHRASHKNVKGCFANEEDDEIMTSAAMMVLEGHKCGICLRVFSSGQALGGHMRCHWDKGDPEPNLLLHHHQGFGLDLNLPPPTIPHDSSSSSPFTLDLRLGL